MHPPSNDERSDESLLIVFRETLDEQAFRELMSRYYPAALRMAESRLRDPAAAQEAVQDAFLRVIRHRDWFRPDRKFSPWFFSILFNLCRDYRRKEARRAARLQGFAQVPDPAPPDDADLEPIRKALDHLPALDREILLLRFAQEAPFSQIAGILGVSVDAAKKRAQRAIRRLRNVLGETEDRAV